MSSVSPTEINKITKESSDFVPFELNGSFTGFLPGAEADIKEKSKTESSSRRIESSQMVDYPSIKWCKICCKKHQEQRPI